MRCLTEEGVIKSFSACEWHIKSESMRSGLRASCDSGKKIKSLNIKETEFNSDSHNSLSECYEI